MFRARVGLSYIIAGVLSISGIVLLVKIDDGQFTTARAAEAVPNRALAPQQDWAAAAPGKVEPLGGEVRISAAVPGPVKAVLVKVNDHVKSGDLLVRLDDEATEAKLAAARADAVIRRRDRDAEKVDAAALNRRKAEDTLFTAEEDLYDSRQEFDKSVARPREAKAPAADVDAARGAVTAAADKVEREKANVKRLGNEKSALTQGEAALAAARAEVAVLRATLDKSRVRAPLDATVLDINAKAGETVAVGGDTPLITLGNTTRLQVRSEVEERDVRNVRVGQDAVIKAEAFPGRSFEGKVTTVAPSLGASQLTSRTQRRPTDIEVLEVTLEIEGTTPLLPGMRVDVFFKAEETSSVNSAMR